MLTSVTAIWLVSLVRQSKNLYSELCSGRVAKQFREREVARC